MEHSRAGRPALSHLLLIPVTAAQLLGTAASGLGVDAALFGHFAGARRATVNRTFGRLTEQSHKTCQSIRPILFTGAIAPGGYDDVAILGEPPAGQAAGAGAQVFGQGRRTGEVEAELNRRRELVDILPTRPAGMDESFTDLSRVQSYMFGNFNHDFRPTASPTVTAPSPSAKIWGTSYALLSHQLAQRFDVV